MEFVVPLKHGTKKISFFMKYSRLFLKYGLEENHWVGHSVMKPVDVVAFQKRKAPREVINDWGENFEIDIFDEIALDKAL